MALLRRKQQVMELSNQSVRSSFRIFEPLANCLPDFSLHTALMEPMKNRADLPVQQEPMPIEDSALLKHRINCSNVYRSDLDIFAALLVDALSQVGQQRFQVVSFAHQESCVIGERNRH